jgi:hypothetical protein
MEKIISVRFEGDNSIIDGQKLTYIRYLNRILAGQRDDIIASRGFVKIISEKGLAGNIIFVSDNSELNKKVGIKLSMAQPPF